MSTKPVTLNQAKKLIEQFATANTPQRAATKARAKNGRAGTGLAAPQDRAPQAHAPQAPTSNLRVMRISGSPLSGKSTLAFEAFTGQWNHEAIRNGKAYLLVSSKAAADQLNTPVINIVQHAQEGRPVRTIGSLAFSLLTQERAEKGEALPHFVDDAERGQAVQQVLENHRQHMIAGDDCETCDLLRTYLSLHEQDKRAGERTQASNSAQGEVNREQNAPSEQLLADVMTPAFIDQLVHLFDMFNGLGVASDSEHFDVILHDPAVDQRMVEEWQLGRVLQHEAQHVLQEEAPDLFLADFSAVLAIVTQALSEKTSTVNVPRVVIMDDCQDLTVAGYSFLEQLAAHGCAVILIGNDDEATRTYRGAFPEALSALEEKGWKAEQYELVEQLDRATDDDSGDDTADEGSVAEETADADNSSENSAEAELSYRTQVATRVSLALTSSMVSTDVALPLRPGKLRTAQMAFMKDPRPVMVDHTLQGRLLRSNEELLDDLVWQVTTSVMHDEKLSWSDCAIIAHTNSVLRQVGERFEEEGIPVRYSSASQLLKDSAIVQGLLAIIRLNAAIAKKDLSNITRYTDLFTQVITSPLFPVATKVDGTSTYRSVREDKMLTIFQTIAYLSQVDEAQATFDSLHKDWQELSNSNEPLNRDAIILLLLMGSQQSQEQILSMYDRIARTSRVQENSEDDGDDQPQFVKYWEAVRAKKGPSHSDEEVLIRAINIIRTLETTADEDELISQPSIALWNAWTACNISDFWRQEALSVGKQAARANDYLDTVVRLFRRAETRENEESAEEFAEWIESLEVEAGSLAQVAPRPDSVVLASPDSANTQHFKKVWIIGVQEGQWPNLDAPDSLLSGQAFSTVAISHILKEQGVELNQEANQSPQKAEIELMHTLDQHVSDFELRAFLVALTRASEETVICAVWNDDEAPSEYLTSFLPEVFCDTGIRTAHNDSERHYTPTGFNPDLQESALFAGFDTSVDGLAIAAKTVLVGSLAEQERTGGTDPARLQDALSALKILQGVTKQAQQLSTGFVGQQVGNKDDDGFTKTRPAQHKPVTLSPSAVDAIWDCPLRWSLQDRFAGPRRSSEDMTFGTIIHNCAQWATDNGYDRSLGKDELLQALIEHYCELREQSHFTPATSKELFKHQSNDHEVADVLDRIATYFVDSRDASYAPVGQKQDKITAGKLTGSAAEVSVNIPLSLSQILPFVRHLSGLEHTTKAELYSALSTVAGDFVDDEPQDLRAFMSARVDRVERREDGDGNTVWNIIDWKTGKTPRSSFDDLQLICYQLGLAFSPALQEMNEKLEQQAGEQSLPVYEVKQKSRMPEIKRSMLFYPRKQEAPAQSHSAENGFQPQLFEGKALYEAYPARSYIPTLPSTFLHGSNFLGLSKAEEISDIAQWLVQKANAVLQDDAAEASSAVWALTMLSRVFYAISYSQADYFPAKKTSNCSNCAFKPVCPLYSHESQTVFGPLTGMNIEEVRQQVKRRSA